jgi:hypothetical protein
MFTNVITPKDVLEFGKEINGFTGHYDTMSGTLEWNDKNGNIIYATPNWYDDGITPFDFADEDGNYETISKLFTMNYPTKFEQLITYFSTLLELTYNVEELRERVK